MYPRRLLPHARSLPAVAALLLAASCDGGTGPGSRPVASVSIRPDSAVVAAGTTLQLEATPRDASGKSLKPRTAAWTSSDTAVASVSGGGLVSARRGGVATITAAVDGRSGTARIRVPSPPGLRIVSAPGDTVGAVQQLVVEVFDAAGAPAAGAVVRFQGFDVAPVFGCRDEDGACYPAPAVAVAGEPSLSFGLFTVATVDARGLASVRMKMGRTAGPARVAVSVPTLGFGDTARIAVAPGAPVRLGVTPRDSAVYVGGAYALRPVTRDRYMNPRTDPVSFTAVGASVAVSDGALRGAAVGRGMVIARSGPLADTVRASVVPRGTLAAFAPDSFSLVVFNLDGSGYRHVARASGLYGCCGMTPDWSPDGTRLIFHEGGRYIPSNARILVADMAGGGRRLISPAPPLVAEKTPQFSADGAWIYFGGVPARGVDGEVWRVRADGSGAERVGPARRVSYDGQPSPSPDGTRVAFESVGPRDHVDDRLPIHLALLDLRTGAVSLPGVIGRSPRWSPSGDQLAYIPGQGSYGPLWVMRPDGSGRRAITGEGTRYFPEFDWSPDGRYLVAESAITSLLEIIDAATGEALPLPFSRRLETPSWRP